MLEANFWQDKENSKKILKEKKFYEDLTSNFKKTEIEHNENKDLFDLASSEQNQEILLELKTNLIDLKNIKKQNKIKFFLSK